MSISRLILSMMILGFVSLVSCSKDETTPTQTDTYTKTMTATIDGTAWDGSSSATVQKVGTMTTITGTGANGQTITFSLNDPIMVHFTQLGSCTFQVIEGSTNIWSTKSGLSSLITIDTATSTIIGGKFNFTASALSGASTGSKIATEGKFLLKY
ncbi:MAG: hypothetical protein HYZ54_06970 [Ignavibacteriae bacterium]|nr:hypothetical protein [Ignavibacteriota bacterium]